jgi:hypothetical protein
LPTRAIIHCLAYLLQFKTFRTLDRHDPKLDLINIKSQQRNHSLTVTKHLKKYFILNSKLLKKLLKRNLEIIAVFIGITLILLLCLWIWNGNIQFSNGDIDLFSKLGLVYLGLLFLFNLPSIILLFNYYLENKNTEFEIDENLNTIIIIQNGNCKTYNLNDFKKSTYHVAYNYKNTIDHKGRRDIMLYSDFGYWELKFKNGDEYYLTNLLKDFVHDAPKIKRTKYRFRFLPFISKSDSKEGVYIKSLPERH